MNDKTTIESKVAATILERNITFEIDGEKYEIAPPSLATLILVSEIISTLPTFENLDKKQWLDIVAHHAKDFKPLGEIAAVLILGAKNLTERREKIIEERKFFGLIKRRKKVVEIIDRKSELANAILLNVRPSELNDMIIERLKQNEAASFFAIITSLSAVNILKPTKAEVIS
ncbi:MULTISPECIES: hypothetical protein [Muribaculaceae]|uniref:Uncharacterized protein n=2 Tax=Muribaculaceae TaxID=2005473 RepID=A0A4Z0V048_9BACT|nr:MULTISPECIES: hypothetical protein [Muribaculaceae]QCD37156.1 hypothetical protein E7746_14545 [Muribaculum gordoncarteri]TGG35080.1 hypothetical protein EZ315_15455 [Duncaniella freteri]